MYPRITLKEVLGGKTCPPASLTDFRTYLREVEFSEENLEFYMLATEFSKPISAKVRHQNAAQKPCAQCDFATPATNSTSLEQLQAPACTHVCKPTVFKSPLEQFMRAYRRNKRKQAEAQKKAQAAAAAAATSSDSAGPSSPTSASEDKPPFMDIYMGPTEPSSGQNNNASSSRDRRRDSKHRLISVDFTGSSDLSDLQKALDKIAITTEIELIPLEMDSEPSDAAPEEAIRAHRPSNRSKSAQRESRNSNAKSSSTTPDGDLVSAASTAANDNANMGAGIGGGLKEPAILELEVSEGGEDINGKFTMQSSNHTTTATTATATPINNSNYNRTIEAEGVTLQILERAAPSSRADRRNSIISVSSTSTSSSNNSLDRFTNSITSLNSLGRLDSMPEEALFETAQALMETFVYPGSPREINIDDRTRRAMIKRFEEIAHNFEDAEKEEDEDENTDLLRELAVPRNMFDDAAKHVFKIMNTDTFPRFLRSAVINMGFFERMLRLSAGLIFFLGSLVTAATMIWHPIESQVNPLMRLLLFLSFTFSIVDFGMCVTMVCPYHWMRGVRIVNNGPVEIIRDPKIISYQFKKFLRTVWVAVSISSVLVIAITFIPARIGA